MLATSIPRTGIARGFTPAMSLTGCLRPKLPDWPGVTKKTILRWLEDFGIPRRTQRQAKATENYLAKMSGPKHPNYKTGKRAIRSGWGYKMLTLDIHERDGHRCDPHGRIPEHVYVMENAIGRALREEEIMHHRNLRRLDNRLQNLILFPNESDHRRYHRYLERLGAFHLGLLDAEPQFEFSPGTVVGSAVVQ